jgi:hypothetical protein
MEVTLGGVALETPSQRIKRFSLLLWGPSGCGKTTLAATAPKNLLWLNFDPDGTDAVANVDGIEVLDFAKQPASIAEKFKEENPIRIKQFLIDRPDIKTVVFDSLTTFGEKALYHGVKVAQGTNKGKKEGVTIESPGYSGFGNKNTWTQLCVSNLLQVTGELERNMIFIAHEDKPEKDSNGIVLYISIMLGSSLNEQVPVKLSEIWNMTDTGKERRIAVRNCRARKPMKSRMFITSEESEFIWHYDADKQEGEGIAQWYERWSQNGGKKIDLPASTKKSKK